MEHERFLPDEFHETIEANWNSLHENEVRYPDNPELEQALMNFRQQNNWYEQQLKYRKSRTVDPTHVQAAWDQFIKLRNEHQRRTK